MVSWVQQNADYDHVIRMQPHFTMAYLSRAQIYEALDQPDAALADYEHFLRIYGAEDAHSAFARSRVAALESGRLGDAAAGAEVLEASASSASKSNPLVSRSRRWTIPGRSGPPSRDRRE